MYNKHDGFFIFLNKQLTSLNKTYFKPIEANHFALDFNYGYGIYNEDVLNTLNFTLLNKFNNFSSLSSFLFIEDTYENLKNFSAISLIFHNNFLKLNNIFEKTTHSNQVFD
jgi:HD superfamily phosphohydrolase YqeK